MWYYKIWKYRNVVLKYSRFCNYHNSQRVLILIYACELFP